MRISVLIKFEPDVLEDVDRIAKRLGTTRTATVMHLLELGMVKHDQDVVLPGLAAKAANVAHKAPPEPAQARLPAPASHSIRTTRKRPDEATLRDMSAWERKLFGWE